MPYLDQALKWFCSQPISLTLLYKLTRGSGLVKMTYLDSDSTTNTLVAANRPELLKGSSSVNGRLVVAGSLENVVCAAVRVDGTLDLSSRRRVVGSVGLNNVVFDERVAGPSVQGDVRIDVLCVPGTAVSERLGGTRVP
jgi:cytoskeletal protein CcmA (bactofilin family)